MNPRRLVGLYRSQVHGNFKPRISSKKGNNSARAARVHALKGVEFLIVYQLYDMPSTPCKRSHNDENAGKPARILNTPRGPFRTSFQPQQLTLFTSTDKVGSQLITISAPVKKKIDRRRIQSVGLRYVATHSYCLTGAIGRAGISFLARCSEFESPMCSITVKCYQPSW